MISGWRFGSLFAVPAGSRRRSGHFKGLPGRDGNRDNQYACRVTSEQSRAGCSGIAHTNTTGDTAVWFIRMSADFLPCQPASVIRYAGTDTLRVRRGIIIIGVHMEKIFYTDSHIRCFHAVVTACWQEGDCYAITLDRTAFYPEGGGQPADTGTIGGIRVLDVQERDGDIIHFIDTLLAANTAVLGEICWERRFSLMQQHSGEHIVSGMILRHYGFDNVGFHIGSDFVTIDFNGSLSDSDLARVERLANEAVFANLPLQASFPEPDELACMTYRSKLSLESGVRIVSIPGYDACACCGTHVSQTGEIGIVKLLSGRRHKGGTRVEMLCGWRAMEDYTAKHSHVTDISALLSAKPANVTEAVRRLMDGNDALKKEIASMKEARMTERVEEVCFSVSGDNAGEGFMEGLILFEEGLAPEVLRHFCLLLVRRFKEPVSSSGTFPGWIAVFSASEDSGYLYVAGCTSHVEMNGPGPQPERDMRMLAKRLNMACSGRGGGTAELVQGSLQATRPEIEAFLHGTDIFGKT